MKKIKELKRRYGAWQDVIKSSSVEDYQENLTKFISTWEPTHKDAVRYVMKTWLDPDKEKFISSWTNNIKHFDNVATSRVESAHAKLKLYLGNSRGNFENCFFRAHCSYENEHVNVHSEFDRSKTIQMHDHREEDLFKEILNFFSIKALKIVYNEINGTTNSMDGDMTCNHLARKINGLPCACEIHALKTQGKVIELDIIDHFWRQLSSSPLCPNRGSLPFEETPEFYAIRDAWDRVTENEQVRMRSQLQLIAFPSTVNVYDPEVLEVQRGRKSKKQLMKDRSNERDPSFYEHVNKTMAIMAKLGEKRNREMLAAEKNSSLINPQYLSCMPPKMQKFIAATQKMPIDENYGYHVLLKQLTLNVKHHNPCRYFRETMLRNIEFKRHYYEAMWGKNMLEELKEGIDKNEWLRMPESGFIIAEAFTTVVVYLSELQSITFVPTTLVLYPSIEKNMVAIGHVNNNHLIGLKFKRYSPLPSLPRFSYWMKQKNENSTAWSKRYLGRMKKYEHLAGIK